MSRVVVVLGMLIALAAAAGAALIVAPAPNQKLALLAILAGEKSFVLIGVAVLGGVLALVGMRPGTRVLGTVTILLAVATVATALAPLAQALRLAGDERANLDYGRYLAAPIDTQERGRPKKTVTYVNVDGRDLGIDVYVGARGAGGGATRPVLVLHGGGWSMGEKGDAALFSQWLADHGATVFDVQYRIAPQPNWKTATGDVKCAIGWVKQHLTDADWNVDPTKLTLLGRSAGGHLALLAAYTPGAADLPPSCDAPDTKVAAVIAYYAPTDLEWGYAHPGNPSVYDGQARIRGFAGGPPDSTGDLYKRLSPVHRVTEGAPRTYLIHGGRDQFVSKDHVEMLTDKLHAVGTRYETLIVPYAQHSFDFVFGGLSEQIVEAGVLHFFEDRGH